MRARNVGKHCSLAEDYEKQLIANDKLRDDIILQRSLVDGAVMEA